MIELEELKNTLRLSILRKDHSKRTASMAYSLSGNKYKAGVVESDTKLLNISSEQLTLAFAAQSNDYKINKIVTLVEDPPERESISPLVGKILIDYSIRSGVDIEYTAVDLDGGIIFHINNVRDLFKRLYDPKEAKLSKVESMESSLNKIKLVGPYDPKTVLKEYAVKAIERNFPTYDSASGYGTAILTEDGTIYFAGQYSSFEERTNIHSEVASALRAIMDGNTKITHLGLASSKYKDEPCNMCGSCRQFLAEISTKFGLNIEIYLFARDNDLTEEWRINKYLPNQWRSKNW